MVYDANDIVVDRLVWYLNRTLPGGAALRVQRFRHEELGIGKRLALERGGAKWINTKLKEANEPYARSRVQPFVEEKND